MGWPKGKSRKGQYRPKDSLGSRLNKPKPETLTKGDERRSMNTIMRVQDLKKVKDRQYYLMHMHAGKLSICKICGDEQKEECLGSKRCMILSGHTVAYVQAHMRKDPKVIENVTIPQLAMLDFLFEMKLKHAIQKMNETKIVTDSDGKKVEREVIDIQYMYALINMAKSLNKSLDDMELTTQSQDTMDVAWAHLAKAKVDPKKAEETKEKILIGMAEWRKKFMKAKEMEKEDPAIQRYEKDTKEMEAEEEDFNTKDIPPSPFSSN